MEDRRELYTIVYRSLLAGMSLSTALFAVGVVLQLLHTAGVLGYNPVPLLKAGTRTMILTPICRMVASIIAFFLERDYRFAAITTFVLLTIVLSVVLGLAGLALRG
jgi:uncharacterized membrane protein